MYVLYANEIFCYISFIDKTRYRLQIWRFKLTDITLYTLYSFLDKGYLRPDDGLRN